MEFRLSKIQTKPILQKPTIRKLRIVWNAEGQNDGICIEGSIPSHTTRVTPFYYSKHSGGITNLRPPYHTVR